MASAQDYAEWIVKNQDKKGSPEFDTVAKAYKASRSQEVVPSQPPAAEVPATPDPASLAGEEVAGHPVTRFALGAAAPFLGTLQAGANAGDKIAADFGLTPVVGHRINEFITELEAIKKRGMAARGNEGYDVTGLLGQVFSPATLGMAGGTTPATYLGKIAQGSKMGATSAAMTPVEGAEDTQDFMKRKGIQTVGGAVVGAAIPAVFEPAKKLVSYLYHAIEAKMPGGTEKVMKRVLDEVAGPKKPAIMGELQKPQELVPGSQPTAGEAATAAGSAEFSALQKNLQNLRPTEYAGRENAQEAARLAAVRSVGRTPVALKAAEDSRAAEAVAKYGAVENDLIPIKPPEDILGERIAKKFMSRAEALRDEGRFTTLASQQENLANNWNPVLGQPRVPARYAPHTEIVPEAQAAAQDAAKIARQRLLEKTFLEHQLDSLMAEVGAESPRLGTLLSRPSMKNALKTAYLGAQESGSYFPTTKEAPFSVANLQRMKQAMDDVLKDPASFGLKATEAKEIGNTKALFTQWLEKRSPGWAEARNAYAAASKPIDQMKVGQYLENKLLNPLGTAERASMFANAVKEAPRTLKQATGFKNYEDLSQVLAPAQEEAVRGVTADLARKATFEDLAKAGTPEITRKLGTFKQPVGYVPLLSRYAMLGQAALRYLEGKGSESTLRELSARMQNPAEVARLMTDAPPSVRQQLLRDAASLARTQGSTASSIMFAKEQ